MEKTIHIAAKVSRKTGLILAVCEERKGLSVFGNTIEEVERRLPGAIRDHFDMLGFDVQSVKLIDSEPESIFKPLPAFISAQASLIEKGTRDTR